VHQQHAIAHLEALSHLLAIAHLEELSHLLVVVVVVVIGVIVGGASTERAGLERLARLLRAGLTTLALHLLRLPPLPLLLSHLVHLLPAVLVKREQHAPLGGVDAAPLQVVLLQSS